VPVPNIKNFSLKERDPREVFGKISLSSHFQVSFEGFTKQIKDHLKDKYNIPDPSGYMNRDGGILCSEASLPATSLATVQVNDNFMGIPQEFAHTRLYTDSDFTFYVSKNYTNLRIFEGWIDYISGGSETKEEDDRTETDLKNYYRRMRYPDFYKVSTMYITKFERDFNKEGSSRIDYRFINAFPKSIAAVPVSYDQAQLLKVTVSFNYDRYITNILKTKSSSTVDATDEETFTDEYYRTRYTYEGDPPFNFFDENGNYNPFQNVINN